MDSFRQIFEVLRQVDDFFWSYIGFTLVVALGIYFSAKTKFFQFSVLGQLRKTIQELRKCSVDEKKGTHPIKLYFASVGGMIGLGNIVGIVTALIYGGPGALFWLWIASFSGMLIKYGEIYLGIKFRQPNKEGGYDGGPMYFIQKAFNGKFLAYLVSFLFCIYGVEVYQFVVVTEALTTGFSLNRHVVIGCLLIAVIYSGLGGIKRLANICSVMMPMFMIAYILMCLWVVIVNIDALPSTLWIALKSAFTGHAAVGGFAGSTFLLAAQHGIARAVYSGDIGIGYDATIQSETRSLFPEKQARLAIFALFSDTIICTMSLLVVLLTGIWQNPKGIEPSQFVSLALSEYFPFMEYFVPILLLLAGFTTIIAFFAVGLKSARFISPSRGKVLYYVYAVFAFIFFSFFDQTKVILIMSLSGGGLLLINLAGIFKLRHDIKFI